MGVFLTSVARLATAQSLNLQHGRFRNALRNTDLLDLQPRLLPLFELLLGLVQVSEEPRQIAAAGRGRQVAEHRRRTRGKAAAYKVPDAACASVQAWKSDKPA